MYIFHPPLMSVTVKNTPALSFSTNGNDRQFSRRWSTAGVPENSPPLNLRGIMENKRQAVEFM